VRWILLLRPTSYINQVSFSSQKMILDFTFILFPLHFYFKIISQSLYLMCPLTVAEIIHII